MKSVNAILHDVCGANIPTPSTSDITGIQQDESTVNTQNIRTDLPFSFLDKK